MQAPERGALMIHGHLAVVPAGLVRRRQPVAGLDRVGVGGPEDLLAGVVFHIDDPVLRDHLDGHALEVDG